VRCTGLGVRQLEELAVVGLGAKHGDAHQGSRMVTSVGRGQSLHSRAV
jgi:hypothetical protein